MSGVWMKLNDVRVRLDRSESEFWHVADALSHLYNVPELAEEELEEDALPL